MATIDQMRAYLASRGSLIGLSQARLMELSDEEVLAEYQELTRRINAPTIQTERRATPRTPEQDKPWTKEEKLAWARETAKNPMYQGMDILGLPTAGLTPEEVFPDRIEEIKAARAAKSGGMGRSIPPTPPPVTPPPASTPSSPKRPKKPVVNKTQRMLKNAGLTEAGIESVMNSPQGAEIIGQIQAQQKSEQGRRASWKRWHPNEPYPAPTSGDWVSVEPGGESAKPVKPFIGSTKVTSLDQVEAELNKTREAAAKQEQATIRSNAKARETAETKFVKKTEQNKERQQREEEKQQEARNRQNALLQADLDKQLAADQKKAVQTQKAWASGMTSNMKAGQKQAKVDEADVRRISTNESILSGNQVARERLAKEDPRFVTAGARVTRQEMPRGYTKVTSEFRDENDQKQKAVVVTDQYGNAIDNLSKRYKSFGEQIVQNYGEVLKWTLAVGLIYGPLQKLNELYTNMIENQTRLAQVTVTLGANQALTNKIFTDAAQIAKETGVDLEGVIEGYNLAYRATGNVASASERTVAANKLLYDSIVLSKIASIEQSTATDVLSASIKQLGVTDLTTTDLLNKWVSVSRVANVDVNTLATSFSIVAEAAMGAGLNVDQLNGMIAVLAEKSSLSAKETGNAARQILTGYSTDAAQKAFGQFGIAVKDAAGNARNMLDVFADVKTASKEGLISPEQVNALARVVTGGSRGQARGVMVMMGGERMGGVSAVSANAPSDAAARAMGILTDTISTKLNKLNISFAELAQSLGTDGGLLDAMGGVVDLTNTLVNGLTLLSKIIGGALPMIAGLALTGVMFKKGSPANVLGSVIGGFTNRGGGNQNVGGVAGFQNVENQANSGWGKFTKGIGGFWDKNAASIITGAGAATTVWSRAQSGDTSGAAMTGTGAVIGGLVGSLAGMTPLGIMIGTAIGEAFAAEVERRKDLIAAALASSSVNPGERVPFPTKEETLTTTQDIQPMLMAATFGKSGIPTGMSQEDIKKRTDAIAELSQSIIDSYNEWVKIPENAEKATYTENGVKKIRQMTMPNVLGQLSQLSGQALYNPVEFSGFGGFKTPLQVPGISNLPLTFGTLGSRLPFTEKELLDALGKASYNKSVVGQSPFLQSASTYGNDYRGLITGLQQQAVGGLGTEFQLGNISARTKAVKTADIENSFGKISQLAYAIKDFGDSTTNITKIVNIVKDGTDEEIQDLINYSSTIADLSNKIKEAEAAGTDVKGVFDPEVNDTVTKTVDDAKTLLNKYIKQLFERVGGAFQDIENRAKIPSIQDYTKKGYTKEEIGQIFSQQSINDFFTQMTAGMRPEDAQALKYQQSQQGFYAKGVGGTQFIQGISTDMAAMLEQQQIESGAIKKGVNVEEVDRNKSEIPGILKGYNALLQRMKGVGYTENLENVVLYTKDKELTDMLKIDNKVFQMYLKDLNDKEQKQLDGMFNLPSGASFYVPYQAAGMSRTTEEDKFSKAVDMFAKSVQDFRKADEASMNKTQGDFRKADEKSMQDYYNNLTPKTQQDFRRADAASMPTQLFSGITNMISNLTGLNVKVEAMPIDVNNTTTVSLMLDGRIIATYVAQEVARKLAQFSRSTTSSAGGGGSRVVTAY